jgi:DNA-binding NarL/FixJ family response regulator
MSMRILIVDDAALVRVGLRLMMEGHEGWAVCGEAQDGEEALEKAVQLKPDVILLDISMPKMNGLIAAPLIRQKVPRAKIVFLTMHPTLDIAREASEAGGSAFVSKDLLTRDLTPTIEALEAAAARTTPFGAPAESKTETS